MNCNFVITIAFLTTVSYQEILSSVIRLNHRDCVDNMCTTSDDYPSKKIKNKLRKSKQYQELSGDVIKLGTQPMATMLRSLEEPEENLCRTKKIKVFPKFVYGEDMERRWVVNLRNFRQGIEYERCVSETPQYVGDILNVMTRCVQQYTVVRFLVYNGITDELEYSEYPVPTTCTCMYKQIQRP